MFDRRILARLRITPCGLDAPVIESLTQTVALVRVGDACRLEVVERNSHTRKQKRWRVDLDPAEVEAHVTALKQATVPAFPVSLLVCDGEYVELMIEGEYATLSLGWWTQPPWGADAFADFADWMREKGVGRDEE